MKSFKILIMIGSAIFFALSIIGVFTGFVDPVSGLSFASIQLLSSYVSPDLGRHNARRKAYPLYSGVTIATGVTRYRLFDGNVSDYLTNRKMPLAPSEIFFIYQLQATVNNLFTSLASGAPEFLIKSFIQIKVNDKEYIKVPLVEILKITLADTIGNTTNRPIATKVVNRSKKLDNLPIIINGRDNVNIELVIPTATATLLNGKVFQLWLNGVKYDELSQINFNAWKGEAFERYIYSVYDTQALTTGPATVYDLFQRVSGKEETDFSKALPLGSKESLQIQTI